jgi:hypothetical protein
MNAATMRKAEKIVKERGVFGTGASPHLLSFKVCGGTDWHDVYCKLKDDLTEEWTCTAVDKKGQYGCVMSQKNNGKPFCSHTLAAKMYLQRKGWEH